jgi:NADH:ubiquinone oxidoreductase subunit 2 (subunit N)
VVHWGIFLPFLTLLSGMFAVMCIDLWGEEADHKAKSFVTMASLLLSGVQTVFLYRFPALVYMRGSFVLDPFTIYISLLGLAMVFFVQVMRHMEHKYKTSHGDLLILMLGIFHLALSQSNRFFLGTLALVGLTWVVLGLHVEVRLQNL